MAYISPIERLEAALHDSSDVYVNTGVDEDEYFAGLIQDIRDNMCEPFTVSGEVMGPGFEDAEVGSMITGLCVAHRTAGYWLVYQPEQNRFYGFWGEDKAHLGAHGVSGSPLYCWSA